ncbi:MAG TPA: HEAT repeat domain-containing protein [Bryobacteraceae bacterium]|nr:HEAT repeat domain-containing protein [Bryobacteraceae bacterium]
MRLALLSVCISAAVLFGQPAGDTKQRLKTARALGKEGSAAVEKLRPYQTDSEVSVRRAAVESLVSVGGQQTLEPLTLSLSDGDGEVQRTAINGIVNFYLPGYYQTGWRGKLKRSTDSVMDRFRDGDDPVVPIHVTARPEIVAALGKVVTESASMDARAAAARALGVLRAKDASGQLLTALQSKNTAVMYEVLTAFEKIRNPEVAPRLFYMLRDPDEKVQIAAIQTVSVLNNKEANGPLREAWERTKNDKVRRALLEAMAMLPDESNRPLFEKYLLDQDEWLRAHAAEGIGRLGKKDDAAKLQTLWDGEQKIRPRLSQAYSLVALGKYEISELSPLQYLINTLNHKSYRGVALGFLKDLAPTAEVRFALHNAVLRANREEKLALADILGDRGGKDSIEALEALSKDADADVASESLRALRTLRLRLQ